MQDTTDNTKLDRGYSQRDGDAEGHQEVGDFRGNHSRNDYSRGDRGRRGRRGRGGAHKSDNWREDHRDPWVPEGGEDSARGFGRRGRGRGRGYGGRGREFDNFEGNENETQAPEANATDRQLDEGMEPSNNKYRDRRPRGGAYRENRFREGHGGGRGRGGYYQDNTEEGNVADDGASFLRGAESKTVEGDVPAPQQRTPGRFEGLESEGYGGGGQRGGRSSGRGSRAAGEWGRGRGGFRGEDDDSRDTGAETQNDRPAYGTRGEAERPYRPPQRRAPPSQAVEAWEEEEETTARAPASGKPQRVQRAPHLRKNCYDESEVLELFTHHHKQKGISLDNYANIPVEMVPRDIMAVEDFSELQVESILAENVARCGYVKPTPVQRYGIPVAIAGNDLMACAQTGSGKTAAFLIPVVQHILVHGVSPAKGRVCYPIAIVLAPTRELALQIYDEVRKLTFRTDIFHDVVYGGTPYPTRFENDILVACPGRVKDIFDRGQLSFKAIKFLILDEADRMLEMGFEEQIEYLVASRYTDMSPPEERQTLMFSATFPQRILNLAKRYLRKQYYLLTVGRVGSTTKNITQVIEKVPADQKMDRLFELIYAHQQTDLVLIFVETKKAAEDLHRELKRENIPSATIHGDRRQVERERALQDFKARITPILVATDVAARGLDIPDVAHVIQFDLPREMDDYTHRIGRTGRAGNKGTATCFYNHSNRNLCLDLYRYFTEHDQVVPDWFRREKEDAEGESLLSLDRGFGGRRRGGGGGGGGGGGARDNPNLSGNTTWGESGGGRVRNASKRTSHGVDIDDGGF